MKVSFSANASRDLDQIVAYIATDKAGAAQGVFDRIKAAAGQLSHFPGMGRAIGRGEMRLGIAQTPYALVYRVTPRGVLILRIRHAAQNGR